MFHLSDLSSNTEEVCTFVYGSPVFINGEVRMPKHCKNPVVYKIESAFISGGKYCCEHHKKELSDHWSRIDPLSKFVNIVG